MVYYLFSSKAVVKIWFKDPDGCKEINSASNLNEFRNIFSVIKLLAKNAAWPHLDCNLERPWAEDPENCAWIPDPQEQWDNNYMLYLNFQVCISLLCKN